MNIFLVSGNNPWDDEREKTGKKGGKTRVTQIVLICFSQ